MKNPHEAGISFAAGLGLEPRYLGPKPSVLPLDDPATMKIIYRNTSFVPERMMEASETYH